MRACRQHAIDALDRADHDVVESTGGHGQRGGAVLPSLLPVTVWAPAVLAVQTLLVHDPSGEIVNVVPAVTLPSELSYWSRPSAV